MSVYDALGTTGWCNYCTGSENKDDELVCMDKEGKFYGCPVQNVLCTPCMKPKERSE